MDAAGNVSSVDEAISTEDLLNSVDRLCEKLSEREETSEGIFLGSLDAKALYPSINTKHAAGLVANHVMETGLAFDGVDMRWATTYVALNMTQAEINRKGLQDVIPTKRARTGKRPTILTYYKEEKE